MCRRTNSRDFLSRLPLLWETVVVVWAIISADHLSIGFSSVDVPIGYPSRLFGRSWSDSGGNSGWCAVETNRRALVSMVPRTEEVADAGTDVVVAGFDIDIDIDRAAVSVTGRRKRKPSATSTANYEQRFRELLEFKELNGHTKVPRRHGKLGDWVNKLRQRKYLLEDEKIDVLNKAGFCWDASSDKRRKEREKWWERLRSLRKNLGRTAETAGSENSAPEDGPSSSTSSIHQQSLVLSFDNLTSSETKWLRRQRIKYIDSGRKPSPKLDKEQIQALNEIDPNWWQTAREKKWDTQYYALKAFKAKHGHCNVTSAHSDKKLFHWVQNTRKKYRAVKFHHEDGLRSDGSPKLSKAQIELLDRIDFNWDPWGHHADCSWLSYAQNF